MPSTSGFASIRSIVSARQMVKARPLSASLTRQHFGRAFSVMATTDEVSGRPSRKATSQMTSSAFQPETSVSANASSA